MEESIGEGLIRELLNDPVTFDESGRAYELLQEYFEGLPLETLRPLLASEDEMIRRSAVFIASELGGAARPLLSSVVGLASDDSWFIRYDALEVILVCSCGEDSKQFVHVVRSLQDGENVIRRLAMRLVSRANVEQLEAGLRSFDSSDPVGGLHREGLSVLLEGTEVESGRVSAMIGSGVPLRRKYGVIAAKRILDRCPELIAGAMVSVDPDVRRFAEEEFRKRAE